MKIEMLEIRKFLDRNPKNSIAKNIRVDTYVLNYGSFREVWNPGYDRLAMERPESPLCPGAIVHRENLVLVGYVDGGYVGAFASREEFLDCWRRNFAAEVIDSVVVE